MLYSEQRTRTYKASKTTLELKTTQTYTYDEKGNVTKRSRVYYTIDNGYDTLDLTEETFADLCEIIMDMGNVNAD